MTPEKRRERAEQIAEDAFTGSGQGYVIAAIESALTSTEVSALREAAGEMARSLQFRSDSPDIRAAVKWLRDRAAKLEGEKGGIRQP